MNSAVTWNADYIDSQYKLWKADPNKVSLDWHFFFEGFELANEKQFIFEDVDDKQLLRQSRVQSLIYSYRDLGHLLACLDPLVACPSEHPLLSLDAFKLTQEDLDHTFFAPRFFKSSRAPLKDIIKALKETYCRSIGVEFMHLQDPAERRWLMDRMEPVRNSPVLELPIKRRIGDKLLEAAHFEQFLNKKYVGVTRFSLEGGDALISGLDSLVDYVAQRGCREIVLGMAHRGRLNIQATILKRPYEEIFSEFENCYDPDDLVGSGDVKYHNGYLSDITTSTEQTIRIFLMNNPSHVESVDPVVEGFSRGRQDVTGEDKVDQILPLLIHGDAAFSGQGIVAETLNMSQLDGYKTGGTIHLVLNNQIGYTTLPENARSTRYSTDIAKMLMVPIFHVHGENPEALLHGVRLAVDYRWQFHKDVVIDLICYRRYGHNEGDEPYFTQPQMYDRIRKRPPLHQLYMEKLLDEGVVNKSDIEELTETINDRLETAYNTIHGSGCPFPEIRFYENWHNYHGNYSHEPVDTSVTPEKLISLSRKLNNVPTGFSIHPKLKRLFKERLKSIVGGAGIDWANAESLAFASLLTEGTPIRLSGQDSGRGTFSQRHSVLVDTTTEKRLVPLNELEKNQASFSVYDSMLSEAGVLAFEYGYSLVQPNSLVIWEAQFGDFANNAQSIIDLFIISGESKWQRLNGIVLMLPHGFEGLGPEHSSARLERFLQLAAEDNMQVCNPTTPAQYFHLLRRQNKSTYRKPLIIMTPKSLLRHPLAVSKREELSQGSFRAVLDDPNHLEAPGTILLCSGKIFYELLQRRNALKKTDISILRIEQFYPFPEFQLQNAIANYRQAQSWYWVQEEPENMGAWTFIKSRLEVFTERPIAYIGRKASSSPATGFPSMYRKEQEAIIEQAVGPSPK